MAIFRKYCIFLAVIPLVILAAEKSEWRHSVELSINPGIYQSIENSAFGIDTLENFGGNWSALSVDAEFATSWENIPAVIQVVADERYGDWLRFYFNYGISRDMEAFYQKKSVNLPQGSNEFEINYPYESWAEIKQSLVSAKIGRQKIVLGPSPERGVSFSGAPYYDAFQSHLTIDNFSWTFVFTSINPYLGGMPHSSGEFPVGSEEYLQRQNSVTPNQHRVFSEPYKSIAVHRYQFTAGRFTVAAMEQIIIGGKAPDLRDVNPFIMWHHSYGDGFSNTVTSLDIAFESDKVGKLYLEGALDDVQYGATEHDGNPTIFAWLLGWNKTFTFDNNEIEVLFEGIYTDPLFGNSRLPLLKHTNRTVYKSNYRDREEPSFVDTYVVDYPVGYYRGPDKLDFWLDIEYRRKKREISLQFAYLNSGDHTLYSDYYGSNGPKWALSGNTIREIRSQFYIKAPLPGDLYGKLAMLYRYFPWGDQKNDVEIELSFSRWITLLN
ncbi:MAG: hypothetical protein OCD01_09630 [Fibrobacterales bacterium]